MAYIYVAVQMMLTGYQWASPFVLANDWLGLFQSFNRIVVRRFLVQGIFFVVFVAFFTNYLADRELRAENQSR